MFELGCHAARKKKKVSIVAAVIVMILRVRVTHKRFKKSRTRMRLDKRMQISYQRKRKKYLNSQRKKKKFLKPSNRCLIK